MRIDIYHHFPQGYEDKLIQSIKEIKMNLDDLIAKVTDENTVIDSGVTLMGLIKSELDAALAANDMTKVQAVADLIDSGKKKIADAIVANTPAA